MMIGRLLLLSKWYFVRGHFHHFPRCSTLQEAESRVEELEALLLQERRERQKEKEATTCDHCSVPYIILKQYDSIRQ